MLWRLRMTLGAASVGRSATPRCWGCQIKRCPWCDQPSLKDRPAATH